MDVTRSGLSSAYGHNIKSMAEETCFKMTAVYIFILLTQNINKGHEYRTVVEV
jgi:hypothetical protein